MANNRKYNYDSLAEVNGNGIDIALFPQIREAIADRMKEIFGNDIDLSTASADGQYINMEALIFNNMYMTLSYLYNNINPNTASGKYLDIMMSLSNIKRKGPTYSTAQLAVKYVGNSTVTPDYIIAQDRNGVTWKWTNPIDVTLQTKKYTFTSGDNPSILIFTCEKLGPVQAYKGTAVGSISDGSFWTQANFQDINGSISLSLDPNFLLYEQEDAVIGTFNETDQSLRNRKAKYMGGNSVTTQQGLETAIYNNINVKDVYIFNNVTGANKTLGDGAVVLNHDVYVAIRYKDNIDIDNAKNEIAQIIYEKLTAGVNTSSQANNLTGGTMTKYQIEFVSGYATNIYWKRCSAVSPTIVITFMENTNGQYIETNDNSSDIEQSIIASMKNYFNSLDLNTIVTSAELQIAMMAGDLKSNGVASFIAIGATINSAAKYDLPITYLEYDTFTFDYTGPTNKTLTISHS